MQNQKFCFKRFLSFIFSGILSFSLILPPAFAAEIQDTVDSKETSNVFLYVGDLVTVKVHSLTRVAISSPGIVDISTATADELVLVGRKVGETPLFIWDELGKHRLSIRVLADDLSLIGERIMTLLRSLEINDVTIEKNYLEGKLVLTGKLSKNNKEKMESAIKEFNPYIINLVVEDSALIEIDIQISELSKTLNETLGVDWAGEGSDSFSLQFEETLPDPTGKLADLFKIGDFNRTQFIQATVNALITEGKGRVLSKPSIVVSNAEEATFNVGGEIPIRTTTTASTGTSQENVSFKNYGIDLNVTPEIRDGKIDIKLDLQIRDIDSANAVGDNVAFTTRKASTKLLVDDGQLIVLAGLIKRNKSESVKRLPFVSRIPVVGLLFRSYSTPTPNSDLELVISLRPRIYGKKIPSKSKSMAKADEIEVSDEVKKELTSDEVLTAKDGKKSADSKKEDLLKKAKEEEKAAKENQDKGKTKVNAAAAKTTKPKAQVVVPEPSDDSKAVSTAKNLKADLYSTDLSSGKKKNGATGEEEAIIAMERTNLPEPTNVLNEDEINAIKKKYGEKLKREMSETISYPYEAREYGWQGTVMLDVTILPDGNVREVKVNKTSGRAIFDTDAVNTAQILAPYDPFAPAKNLKEVTITVPVEYSEKAVLGNGNGNGSAKSAESANPSNPPASTPEKK